MYDSDRIKQNIEGAKIIKLHGSRALTGRRAFLYCKKDLNYYGPTELDTLAWTKLLAKGYFNKMTLKKCMRTNEFKRDTYSLEGLGDEAINRKLIKISWKSRFIDDEQDEKHVMGNPKRITPILQVSTTKELHGILVNKSERYPNQTEKEIILNAIESQQNSHCLLRALYIGNAREKTMIKKQMHPTQTKRKFLFLFGGSSNGKSGFVEMLEQLKCDPSQNI
jgi:hypothetical protein